MGAISLVAAVDWHHAEIGIEKYERVRAALQRPGAP